jgi:hypothetical protein
VQLFTSEGCSSCPPADALLSEFSEKSSVEGATLIPMSLHVDYWDRLGWRDLFSKAEFSAYQARYARIRKTDQVYTPQMIVDGREGFVGSVRAAATKAVRDAANRPKAHLALTLRSAAKDANAVRVVLEVDGRDALPGDRPCEVLLAVTEDGLEVKVPRGENQGSTLRHAAVVRSLARVATVPARGPFAPVTSELRLDPEWKRERLHVVAFIQAPDDLHIYGAARAKPPAKSRD